MKKVLTSVLLILSALAVNSQVGINIGVGGVYEKGGKVGSISHADAFYRFHPMYEFPEIQQQASLGFMYSPFNEKSIYSVKYGIVWNQFILNFGAALINQDLYTTTGQQYVRADKTIITGLEYSLKRKKSSHPYIYAGGDYIDKDLFLKVGIRFISSRTNN